MRIGGSIPKGLHHAAQGCEERATLGATFLGPINPERVAAQPTTDTPSQAAMQPLSGLEDRLHIATQGSSQARNPGLKDSIPLGWPRETLDGKSAIRQTGSLRDANHAGKDAGAPRVCSDPPHRPSAWSGRAILPDGQIALK